MKYLYFPFSFIMDQISSPNIVIHILLKLQIISHKLIAKDLLLTTPNHVYKAIIWLGCLSKEAIYCSELRSFSDAHIKH